MWLDGICKKCGALVIETGARDDMSPEAIEASADYKNMCTNERCEEHKWHYVGDMEESDYYIHDPEIGDKISMFLNVILKELRQTVELIDEYKKEIGHD